MPPAAFTAAAAILAPCAIHGSESEFDWEGAIRPSRIGAPESLDAGVEPEAPGFEELQAAVSSNAPASAAKNSLRVPIPTPQAVLTTVSVAA